MNIPSFAFIGVLLPVGSGCYSANTLASQTPAVASPAADTRVVWGRSLSGKLSVSPIIESKVSGDLTPAAENGTIL